MDKSFLKSPLGLIVIAVIIAIIPLFFNNDSLLIMFRLVSFGILFFAVPLYVKSWLRNRK